MRPGAPAGGSGRIGRNLPFKGNKTENELSFLSRKIRFVYKEGGRDGATVGKGGGVSPLFIPAGAGERLFLFPLRPCTLWPMCRPRLFLPCHQHWAAIGHPALSPASAVAGLPLGLPLAVGMGGRPFSPFLPAPTASLSLASMGCGGTARPLFPVLTGGRADFPSSPRSDGTEGPLRFSSRRWSRVSSPLSPIELFPLFSPFVMVRRGCGPPLLLTSEGRALSLPPHAGQGLHPHSATPVGSGRALPTPSLCGGTGAVLSPLSPAAVGADLTDRMKREVPLQSASTERWRPKAVGRQKEAVDGQGCPALSRSPFPLRPQGRGACCGRGPPLPSSRAPVRRPSAQSPFPALCKRPARVTHRLPFSRPLPPLSRRVPCPHRVPAGKEKRAPGPHRGGAELF